MIPDLIVHPHALKHGVSEADVEHAFENAYATRTRGGPYPPEYVSVGPDHCGRDIQLVCVWRSEQRRWLVFHAMPATKKVLRELGLV